MAKVLRPIGHEDRLSIVDHLDELRSRLFVCLAVLVVAFGICFWQNNRLIHVLNRALPSVSLTSGQHGLAAVPDETVKEREGLKEMAQGAAALASSPNLTAAERRAVLLMQVGASQAAKYLPDEGSVKEKPITIGVGEPFTTTLAVALWFALLFSLPVLLYEAYAFVLPALNPKERKLALPVMLAAPCLFIIGVAFTYFVILPPAIHFLQGYNSDQFDVLVQAKAYYTFQMLTMLGIGLVFQLPLGLLALQRLGVINSRTLTKNWRYITVAIAVIAATLPGADPVTTGLEMLPLVVLYGASIVMLKIADRRDAARAAAEAASSIGNQLDPT